MLPEDELTCMYFPWDDCCYLLLAFNVQIPLASNDDYSNEKGTNEKKKMIIIMKGKLFVLLNKQEIFNCLVFFHLNKLSMLFISTDSKDVFLVGRNRLYSLSKINDIQLVLYRHFLILRCVLSLWFCCGFFYN